MKKLFTFALCIEPRGKQHVSSTRRNRAITRDENDWETEQPPQHWPIERDRVWHIVYVCKVRVVQHIVPILIRQCERETDCSGRKSSTTQRHESTKSKTIKMIFRFVNVDSILYSDRRTGSIHRSDYSHIHTTSSIHIIIFMLAIAFCFSISHIFIPFVLPFAIRHLEYNLDAINASNSIR